MKLLLSLLLTITGVAVASQPNVAAASADSSTAGTVRESDPSSYLILWACGPKSCNCTTADANLSICDTDTVTVTVGDKPLTISTGHSTGSCSSQTVPGGACIWKCYKLSCSSGWFGWSCKATGASALKSGPAGSGDCPPN